MRKTKFHQNEAPILLGTNGAGTTPAPPGNLKIEVPEPLPPAPGLTAGPQHHQLFTPPLELGGSLVPLQDLGSSLPDFKPPSGKRRGR